MNLDLFECNFKIEVMVLVVKDVINLMDIKLVVIFIKIGYIVRLIFKYCLNVDILVLIFDELIECGLMLNWGVILMLIDVLFLIDDMFEIVECKVVEVGFV